MLPDFSTFDPYGGALIAQESDSLCQMSIRESNELRWMVSDDGVLHGAMLLSEPSKPVLPTIEAMLLAQELRQETKNILCLGLGAGSIERYVAETKPSANITSVEISQSRLEQVKRFFTLPPCCKVVIDDAANVMKSDLQKQDIIYCDLFDTSAQFNSVLTESFIQDLYSKLNDNGVLAINYVCKEQQDLVQTLVQLRKHIPTTGILEVAGHANVVIFGINGALVNQHNRDEPNETAYTTSESKITWLPPTQQD